METLVFEKSGVVICDTCLPGRWPSTFTHGAELNGLGGPSVTGLNGLPKAELTTWHWFQFQQ